MYASKRSLNYYYLMRQKAFYLLTLEQCLKPQETESYTKNVLREHMFSSVLWPLRERGRDGEW